MLLNQVLKEHRKVEEQEATISQVKLTVAQQKEFRATAEANRSSDCESSESERSIRTQQAGAAPGG
jgi:hypothetical protein